MPELLEDILKLNKELQEENHRLRIENGLLRKASEEQRELNGSLRVELQGLRRIFIGQS